MVDEDTSDHMRVVRLRQIPSGTLPQDNLALFSHDGVAGRIGCRPCAVQLRNDRCGQSLEPAGLLGREGDINLVVQALCGKFVFERTIDCVARGRGSTPRGVLLPLLALMRSPLPGGHDDAKRIALSGPCARARLDERGCEAQPRRVGRGGCVA